MTSDDPNHRPTLPLQPTDASREATPPTPHAAGSPDLTRTFAADPSATLPFTFGPPITEPVPNWPPGLTRYRPLHALGGGGMGVVYLCHDTQLDRQVALKFPGLGRSAPQDRIDFALAEARAAARLHHPGICPLFDAAVCDGMPYLTMGFVQGPTLAAEIKRLGPCPPDYATKLVRDVAEAMQYAHEHGVIHRDLKPGNILLTADHEPIVTDFGLAVRLDSEGLAHGVISGTPHYMAPEQAAGDAAKIGERTDVFALGVILFEMLTGRVPFNGTALEVLEQVKTKPVPPVRKLRKDVPERLARIVAKATARNPADRFDGMTAFADALSDYLRRGKEPTQRKRSPKWLIWLVASVTGAFVLPLLCCGLGYLLPAIQKVRDAANRIHNQKQRDEFIRVGKELADRQLWTEARTNFDDAIRLDPTSITALVERAKVLEQVGHLEAALVDWAEAIRLEPNEAAHLLGRADLLVRLKRHREALADLNRVIELDSKNSRAFRLRAQTKIHLGDLSGSESDSLRATDLERERPPVPPAPIPPPSPGG